VVFFAAEAEIGVAITARAASAATDFENFIQVSPSVVSGSASSQL
jgi:hypothetical protein